MIQSKFAQKLANGSYLCLACKIKCGDHISAVKHFASADHRGQLDALKAKAGQVLLATTTTEAASVALPLIEAEQPPSFQLMIEEEEVQEDDQSIQNEDLRQFREELKQDELI